MNARETKQLEEILRSASENAKPQRFKSTTRRRKRSHSRKNDARRTVILESNEVTIYREVTESHHVHTESPITSPKEIKNSNHQKNTSRKERCIPTGNRIISLSHISGQCATKRKIPSPDISDTIPLKKRKVVTQNRIISLRHIVQS